MTNNQILQLSICITDVPKTTIKKASNGKLYFRLEAFRRKEADQYGNDLSVVIPTEKGEKTHFVGSGKVYAFEDSKPTDFVGYVALSVCLSDIPKDKFSTSSKNGKSYVNITARYRKEVDKQGNEIALNVSQTESERNEKQDIVFCGNGKVHKPKYTPATDDDLAELDSFFTQQTVSQPLGDNTNVFTPAPLSLPDFIAKSNVFNPAQLEDDVPF